MACITLLTDFGLKDGNVGVMKGVIHRIAPATRLIDLSHSIKPQNLYEAAFVLNRSATYFPEGTIHVVVVDPGVGTSRRPLAARIGPYYFVGPDNGVVTRFRDSAILKGWPIEFFELNQPSYWLPQVSDVFHGRDIFAPSAAHLAIGARLEEMGTAIHDPVELPSPKIIRKGNLVVGEVIYVDNFGSLVTNIRKDDIGTPREVLVRIKQAEIIDLVRTFGEAPEGTLIALFSSTEDLIISVVNGSAAEQLGASESEKVEVFVKD